jgi:hypothetical protein
MWINIQTELPSPGKEELTLEEEFAVLMNEFGRFISIIIFNGFQGYKLFRESAGYVDATILMEELA